MHRDELDDCIFIIMQSVINPFEIAKLLIDEKGSSTIGLINLLKVKGFILLTVRQQPEYSIRLYFRFTNIVSVETVITTESIFANASGKMITAVREITAIAINI